MKISDICSYRFCFYFCGQCVYVHACEYNNVCVHGYIDICVVLTCVYAHAILVMG